MQTTEPKEQEWDEVFNLMSWWDSDRVRRARVLVVGAGALGNEVLKNLALLNVGEIFLIDFDRIEYTNLSRSVLYRESDLGKLKAEVAAERVRDINPNVKIHWINGDIIYDLGLGLIDSVDVIIGCLDNRVARLYLNRFAHRLDKVWINAGIINLAGMLDVFQPGVSCYECGLSGKDWDQIRKRMGCTDIAKRNASFGRLPTTPISASILGAMQVQEAFKVIYGNEAELTADRRYFYDGRANESIYYPARPLRQDCQSHEEWPDITHNQRLNHRMTVSQLLDELEQTYPGQEVAVLLDYDVITELYSQESERSSTILLPRFRISDQVYAAHQFIAGELVSIPNSGMLNRVDRSFPQQDATLYDIGIPPWQILQVEAGPNLYHVSLFGDADHYSTAKSTMHV